MKILLAVDGSPCSDAAIREVASRPWPKGTLVEVVTALEGPSRPDPFLIGVMMYDVYLGQLREAVPALLEAAAQQIRAGAPELSVTTKILEGAPKIAIVEEAENWGADLVMVGSHGYGPIRRFVLGSISFAVALQAPCSVEIVRCRPSTEPLANAGGAAKSA